jgi:outer membrane immunogenic protein
VFPFTYDASQQLDWFATVRGRVGVGLCGGTLVYFTGGYAFGRAEYDATYLIPQNGASATLHANNFQDGYVLGGGIEHQLSHNWSLKIEYQYLDLGDGNVSGPLNFANGRPSGETVATRYDVDLQTVRVGLNYRFDDQEPPIQPLK